VVVLAPRLAQHCSNEANGLNSLACRQAQTQGAKAQRELGRQGMEWGRGR
jgi:hypothetical protein